MYRMITLWAGFTPNALYRPEEVAVLIPHEVKFKSRPYSSYWPEGMAVLIPHEDRFKVRSYSISFVKILFNVWARGGGSFDPS